MTRAANRAFLTAVYHDQLDDCRKLFDEARVDPATASVDGVNALVVALACPLERRNAATALWLLERRCDPFAVDGCGVSAVTLACADETTPTELMDAFIDAAGEDANKRMRFVDACCRFGRLDALRRFARRGVGIDSSPVRRRFAMATFRYGMEVDLWRDAWATGAHAAAFVGRRDFFRNASAFANARDDVGRTPLMYAIDGRQSVEFIEFMIREMGADVDASADEPYGSTLRHACRARRADVVETLARASSAGRDVSERDAFVPHTAFGFFTGDTRVVELLVDAGYSALSACAELGWPPLFYLIDATARDATRQPGRREEIVRARMKLIAWTLREHARAGEEARCASGRTALMLAAAHDLAPICETILDLDVAPAGAMTRVDRRGRTAFHWACHRGSESTLALFKTRGLLDRVVLERRDADGAVGGDLLAASRDSSRKHHEWPDPISRDDIFDRGRESTEDEDDVFDGGRESTEDVAASVALAQRACVELFDVDVFARRPRTCATCFRLTTDPKRCSRCRAKIYCSVACQRLDWPEHARECAPASPSLRETLARTPA